MKNNLGIGQPFPEGDEMALENLVDLYIKLAPPQRQFHFNDLDKVITKDFPEFKEHRRRLRQEAISYMEKSLHYISKQNSMNDYRLTSYGEAAHKNGHFAYVRQQEDNKKLEEQRKADEHKLTLSTIEALEFSKKTRYIAYGSFIISILTLLYTIFS